ncbi:hypothetical protein [Campylobacter fetus]|uniref:hypothetical protein n=1 Tax=Campylobacter fetus TaxID=196 RepID=UPI00168D7058|nr:hypothetical protein [Campylobacter fetus]MBD3865182.1 hypothetical protein [Campylobacter fetus]
MGSSKHVDWHFTLYSPVVNTEYDGTIKVNSAKNNLYPLETSALKSLIQNSFNRVNSSDNMKSVLKNLREVYNLGMSRKLPTYRKVTNSVKTLDIDKVKKYYGSDVITISDDIYSEIFKDYIKQISNGEMNNLEDFFGKLSDIIYKEAKKFIIQKNIDSGLLNNVRNKNVANHFFGLVTPIVDVSNIAAALEKKILNGGYIHWLDNFTNVPVYNLGQFSRMDYEYLGENIFRVKVAATTLVEGKVYRSFYDDNGRVKGYTYSLSSYEKTFIITKDTEFPEYCKVLFDMIDNEEFRLAKLEDGRVVYIPMNDNKFFTIFTKRIEFSPTIALKGIRLDGKSAKYTNLIREKLNIQENKFKKKNRESKLYESLQGHSKILHAELGLYLDLFPFKNRKLRRKKEWQLYLKGIMKYFARIAGVPSSGGVGFVSIPVPSTSHFISDGGSGDGLKLQGMTLNINIEKRHRDTKPKEICYFSKHNGNGNVLLHLVVSDGSNGYFEYILDYSYFYRGISKDNTAKGIGLGLTLGDALFNYMNKTLFDEYMNVFKNELIKYIHISSTKDIDDHGNNLISYYLSYDNISNFPLINNFKFSIKEVKRIAIGSKEDKATPHQPSEKISNSVLRGEIQNEAYRFIYELSPSGSEGVINPYERIDDYVSLVSNSGSNFWNNILDYNNTDICWENNTKIYDNLNSQNIHPRLPMPIGLWNSIPYRGKFVAYNSSLLIRTYNKETVKVKKGWAKALGPLVSIVTAIVAVATQQYYLIAAVGLGTAAVGAILKVDWLTTVGMSMATGAMLGSGIETIMTGNLSAAIGGSFTSPMFYLGMASKIAVNLHGMSLENKIKGMTEDLKNKENKWEEEKSNRINPMGGINKTSSGGDEDFDMYYSVTDQEMLYNAIEMSIDTESNSQVFNGIKYDNTRIV